MSTIWIEKQENWGSRIKKDFIILECIKEKMAYYYWDSGLLKGNTDFCESKIFKNLFIKLNQKQRDVLQQFYDNGGVEYCAQDIQFNTLNFLHRNNLISKTSEGLYYFTKQAKGQK